MPGNACYFYMAQALRLSLQDPNRLLLVTKRLYPDVARDLGTNWKSVERSLRRAVDIIWDFAPDKLSEMAYHRLTERPSVSEVLSLLTIHMTADRPI